MEQDLLTLRYASDFLVGFVLLDPLSSVWCFVDQQRPPNHHINDGNVHMEDTTAVNMQDTTAVNMEDTTAVNMEDTTAVNM